MLSMPGLKLYGYSMTPHLPCFQQSTRVEWGSRNEMGSIKSCIELSISAQETCAFPMRITEACKLCQFNV